MLVALQILPSGGSGFSISHTMDADIKYYIAYHFPTEQYIPLQEYEHYFDIMLWDGCPHNSPELDLQDKDVSLLHYVLDNIGELILDEESSTPYWWGLMDMVSNLWTSSPCFNCMGW